MPDNLDALAAQAAELDAAAAAQAGGPEQPQPKPEAEPASDPRADLAGLLATFRELVRPMFPSVANVYDDPTVGRVSDALAPVFVKHGWSVGELFGAWREEIMAAFVCVPVAVATVRAMKDDLEARAAADAKPVQPDPAPPPAPAPTP
jgi:hypothetical protein